VSPARKCPSDADCCTTRIVDDRPVAESEHLPAGVREVAVLAAVPLKLIAVEAVCRPPVAFQEYRRASETEVDLPPSDALVKCRWRKLMATDEFGKNEFEDRIGGSMIDRPFIDGGTERRYAWPAAMAVLDGGRGECVKVEEAATERSTDGRFDQQWIVSSEVAQSADRICAADSVATLWRESLTVGWPMQHHTGQAGSAISFRDGEVDEPIRRLDQIPECGRGPVRGHCLATGGQNGCMDPLPLISRRTGQPGDAAVDLDQRTCTYRTTPGVDAQPGRAERDEAVMLARPVIEVGESHATTVGMDGADGEAPESRDVLRLNPLLCVPSFLRSLSTSPALGLERGRDTIRG
jgi:hypothetical protein